jgi:hypothetical protein
MDVDSYAYQTIKPSIFNVSDLQNAKKLAQATILAMQHIIHNFYSETNNFL